MTVLKKDFSNFSTHDEGPLSRAFDQVCASDKTGIHSRVGDARNLVTLTHRTMCSKPR